MSGRRNLGAPIGRRAAARWVVATLAVFVAAAFGAVPAGAVSGYEPAGSFGDEGVGDGAFTAPRAVAVAPDGDVLVVDRDNDRVQVFTPTAGGADYQTQFGAGVLDHPSGIAIDRSDGSIYVSDEQTVHKFTSGLVEDPSFTRPSAHGQVAVDPTTGDLLVAGVEAGLVLRYRADGTQLPWQLPNRSLADIGAVAVDSHGEVLIVTGTAVQRYRADLQFDTTLTGLTQPTALAVNADDQVVVGDSNFSYDSSVMPSVRLFDAGTTAPRVSYPLPEGNAIWGSIQGVAVAPGDGGRVYVVSDKDRGFGSVRVFAFSQLVPVAPTVASPTVADVSADGALLGATVNPGNGVTSFHVEWGADTGYGHVTASRSAGEGADDRKVNEYVSGLEPSTTYHFRVVADNGVGGPVATADQTFTTALAPPTASAPSVTGVTPTSAKVLATVDTFDQAGTYTVTLSATDSPYAKTIGPVALAVASGPREVAVTFDDLPAGHAFTVEVSVGTGGGVAASGAASFATPSRAPYVPPPAEVVADARYGCAAPRLAAHDAVVRPGARLALDGADLGVYGTVTIGAAVVRAEDYSSDRIVVTVPSGVRGTVPVAVNCGRASNAIALVVRPAATLALSRGARKGAVWVTAKVNGAGTLRLTGTRLVTATSRPAKAGGYRLVAKLTKAGGTALKRRAGGRLSIKARVSFRPADGGSSLTKTIVITFDRGALR